MHQVADFLEGYEERRRDRIHELTQEIERRIQALMLHLGHLERERIVAAVKRLYLDKLRVGNTVIQEPVPPQTGELLLTQAIARAVDRLHPHVRTVVEIGGERSCLVISLKSVIYFSIREESVPFVHRFISIIYVYETPKFLKRFRVIIDP